MFNFEVKGKLSQRFGKTVINPKINIIPPEIYVQKSCGIFINRVLAFKIKVNSMIDNPSEDITTKTLLLLSVVSEIERPTIIGSSGSIHGASIVRTPAMNDMRSNVMVFI